MSAITDNVRQVLLQLVPASIVSDITCYVFYDNHPRDAKNIDIIVCTKMGQVREYYKRDLLSCFELDPSARLSDIKIFRNSKCERFYLVTGGEDLTILSEKDGRHIYQKLNSVDRYDINDTACTGQPTLKVFYKDNEIPMVADDNLEDFRPLDYSRSLGVSPDEELPMSVVHLVRKLVEAKYSVKCNEKSLKQLLKFRQLVAFSAYKKIHSNLDDSVFKDENKYIKMANALLIRLHKPWIKSCNKNIVIVYNVCNKNKEPLEDVHLLLHVTSKISIEYTTKIFEKADIPPYWNEATIQTLKPNTESAIVVVLDFELLKYNEISKLEFNGVITYKKNEVECFLPLDEVRLSSLELIGQEFDVLASDPMDGNIMLAVLASTEKTDLILRRVEVHDENTKPSDQSLDIDIFCKYLQMELVSDSENVVVHRKSPYHVLNGLMIVLDRGKEKRSDVLPVTVYSRSPSQVLALIHLIHDAVPIAIVTTTPDQKITARNDMRFCNEYTLPIPEPTYDYINYASSILNRTGLVLKYLNDSMIHMSVSKDRAVLAKLGSEIDLFAQGELIYKDFKEKMRAEASNGVTSLLENLVSVQVSDEMSVD